MATKKRAAKAKKATKKTARKTSRKTSRKTTSKRELIAPRGDKRYVRRSKTGQFTESDDQGKSLSRDVRQKAKTKVKAGQGDKGDRR
jgi:hypothetical protein